MFKKYSTDSINESYLHTVYNGLNIIIIPKKEFTSAHAIYATKYGSINNKFRFKGQTYDVPDGIAHFLEHKMFEKPDGDAFAKYAKTGASANAFTSFINTAYLFTCTDNFIPAFNILAEVVNEPYFTEESVKKEQGIIAEEIKMGLDNPGRKCFYNLLECLFVNHPVKKDIAGSIESIAQITPELLYTCYDAFYNPANMVLCVCGNVDENKIIEVLSKRMRKTEPEKVERLYDQEPDEILESKRVIHEEVSLPMFEFGIKDSFKGEGKELVVHRIIIDIILEAIAGKSTKLYLDMYNEGLIDLSLIHI